MKLTWQVNSLLLKEPFRISRSTMTERDIAVVCLTCEDFQGFGEVVSSPYFQLDIQRIEVELRRCAVLFGDYSTPEELLPDLAELSRLFSGTRGVFAGVDAAVHDLVGKRQSKSVHRVIGMESLPEVVTAYTVGLASPEESRQRAHDLVRRGFSVLKVKVGDPETDIARVAAVRAGAPQAQLLL